MVNIAIFSKLVVDICTIVCILILYYPSTVFINVYDMRGLSLYSSRYSLVYDMVPHYSSYLSYGEQRDALISSSWRRIFDVQTITNNTIIFPQHARPWHGLAYWGEMMWAQSKVRVLNRHWSPGTISQLLGNEVLEKPCHRILLTIIFLSNRGLHVCHDWSLYSTWPSSSNPTCQKQMSRTWKMLLSKPRIAT